MRDVIRPFAAGIVAAWFLFAAAATLHGQDFTSRTDTSFWTSLKDGTVVTRCVESSAAHKEASARLDRLDERIKALRNPDPAGAIVGELHALLKTHCFLLASETRRIPNPDMALSLKEWWIDAHGREWLASFLSLPRSGVVDGSSLYVVVPPDARKTLNLEAHRKHALAALLCPLDDVACGAETREWKRRAENAFQAQVERERRDPERSPDDPPLPSDPRQVAKVCTDDESPEDGRYWRWRDCVERHRPRRMALPLGGFKAPTTGWLIIEGRRGHHSACFTTRAYDLGNGATFIHDRCRDLDMLSRLSTEQVLEEILNPRLKKDRKPRTVTPAEHVRAGTIPAEKLREALWMMLLRGEARAEIQLRAEYYPLPAGLTPSLKFERDHDYFETGRWWGHSGQTHLTWRWGTSHAGEFTWPNSADAADNHAAHLLDIAEDAFVEGCPPSPMPPASVSNSKATSTSKPTRTAKLNGVDNDAIAELDRAYLKAVEVWKKMPACSPPRDAR